jgi:hypothetical protein
VRKYLFDFTAPLMRAQVTPSSRLDCGDGDNCLIVHVQVTRAAIVAIPSLSGVEVPSEVARCALCL